MQRSLLGAVLLLAGIATPALANLGDSYELVAERYGNPEMQQTNAVTGSGLITRYYPHGKYWITVTFLNGKSQAETVQKLDHTDLSEKELSELLESDRLGSKWQRIYDGANNQRWLLDSRGAMANHYNLKRVFVAATKAYEQYIAQGATIYGERVDGDNWIQR